MAPLTIAFLAAILGLLMAARRTPNVRGIRSVILFGMPAALTFALTIKSYRMVEYLTPALALWTASLFVMVDGRRFMTELQATFTSLRKPLRAIALPMLILLALALPFHHAVIAWEGMHHKPLPYEAYRTSIGAISGRAQSGDRVFHSNWDEFPVLFAADDRLRYISGLDPTFLYEANPVLSDRYFSIVLGMNTTTHWEFIHDRLGARFVFITLPRHQAFDETVRHDQRFMEIARDAASAAYEVRSPTP
jgi:hypothetical protein